MSMQMRVNCVPSSFRIVMNSKSKPSAEEFPLFVAKLSVHFIDDGNISVMIMEYVFIGVRE